MPSARAPPDDDLPPLASVHAPCTDPRLPALMRQQSPHQCFTVDPVGLRAPGSTRGHNRGRVDDMALNAFLFQHPVNPEPIQSRLLDHHDRKVLSHSPPGLLPELEKSSQQAGNVAPGTACFDILSPDPGESDVTSQIERLSSNDTKIAPRSVRMAAGLSCRGSMLCMIVSEVRVEATSLCLGAGRYPLPMGSQPCREHLAIRPRQLALQPRVLLLRQYPRPLLRCLEQTRRSAVDHHVHRTARLGT